jgi:hypothetical protein
MKGVISRTRIGGSYVLTIDLFYWFSISFRGRFSLSAYLAAARTGTAAADRN